MADYQDVCITWSSVVALANSVKGISYSDLAYSSSSDFAAVSANSGHNGTSGVSMFRNPDVVADFVYRS
jgi:hypothetical protein